MSVRLLSFLSAIENALRSGPALPAGRELTTTRIVDYRKGIARMNVRLPAADGAERRGNIQLQQLTTAEGRACLRASLAWDVAPPSVGVDIFGTAETVWKAEAGRLARAWLDRMPAGAGENPLAATG